MKTTIKNAWNKFKKTGENPDAWVTFKDIEEPNENQVWVIDEYDRYEKAYLLHNWADVSKYKYVEGNKVCYVDFTF